MVLSPGGLAGYLLLGILANVALIAAVYWYEQKLKREGKAGIKPNMSDRAHGLFR
jgi:hypothetical protein